MAGKKLVDEGGPTFEAYLTAKANYRSAVQADAVSLEHIQDTIAQYEAIISEIGKVLSSDIADEQKAELASHVESAKARLQTYTRIANAIDAPPPLYVSLVAWLVTSYFYSGLRSRRLKKMP